MLDNRTLSITLIAIGAFALGMASYVTAGLIPLIEADFAVSVALAAQLVTAFTLAYGLGSPLVVALLPAHWQRTGLMLSLLVFVIANAGSALAPDITSLILLRAIAGTAAGVYLAIGIAAAATLAGAQGRGKAIAMIMGGMASGTVLGVPGGLLLAERLGWQAALWLVAALGLAALLGLLAKLPRLSQPPAEPLGRKLRILADGRVLAVLSVSLLAAVASLGMYTFIAPFMTAPEHGGVSSVTPYLWVWGIGGVVGSFLVALAADRIPGPRLALGIMVALAASLFALPLSAAVHPWITLAPIALWGAVGWALQVPQNGELLRLRQHTGDGDLAVALNESALYLGSALGAAVGGLAFAMQMHSRTLAIGAGLIATVGALIQIAYARARASETHNEAKTPDAPDSP
ncbi:MFS transporter [Aquisalimonas asiatica]|uniref:Predicted arabinose efflux permease, MFS family n=1 Tax=Aquisalimonas asiatica TaxID=406100 RepID=A0A1H8SY74_9GAMM|nr:MFS transporter [Aquisalimonas asiatica]SEO83587.1 Predicted arabinose efflux permease, MFS family [Aquisalimonas asiatica]